MIFFDDKQLRFMIERLKGKADGLPALRYPADHNVDFAVPKFMQESNVGFSHHADMRLWVALPKTDDDVRHNARRDADERANMQDHGCGILTSGHSFETISQGCNANACVAVKFVALRCQQDALPASLEQHDTEFVFQFA